MLFRMIATAADPVVKKGLLEQLESLGKSPAQSAQPVSATDAVKRAEGTWKDANMRHDQAIHNVVRLRDQLQKAQDKGKSIAKELAEAEIGRRLAAEAFAVETCAVNVD